MTPMTDNNDDHFYLLLDTLNGLIIHSMENLKGR